MKKIISFLLIIVLLLSMNGCKKKVEKKTDAIKFKEEYESINNKTNESNNKKYRSITISKNNPFVYSTAEKIVERIKDKETFIVYFGFKECPWCRSILEELTRVSIDQSVAKIYYVDVTGIRDVKELDEGNNIVTKEKGSDAYLELIDLLKDVLEDYTLTKDEEKIEVGEKRIYAPNVVAIQKGKALQLETGIPEELTDPYMELTESMKKYTYNKFKCLIKCLEEEKTTCQKNSC